MRAQVLVVHKKSAYQIYVQERGHARMVELLEQGDASVSRLMRAHRDHEATIELARQSLRALGVKAVFRRRSDPSTTARFDLVVTLGGDGTLLAASHMVPADCPVIAINSAPSDSVGHFCAATKEDLAERLAEALRGALPQTRLTRMQVSLDGQTVSTRVLNDLLFAHTCPAATTRYAITVDGRSEEHKSSGVWVATAAGSTAAVHSAGGKVQPIGSRRLQYAVREPYAAAQEHFDLLRGFIAPGEQLELQSHIRAGCLYIDGPHIKRAVPIGARLLMQRSSESLTLLGYREAGAFRSPPHSKEA
ncbi:MAG: NAD(+)/NADH kinase [Myxococcales bacterium]|nr:NAD(+)/NADH kinase [Myxococcales bacterium]